MIRKLTIAAERNDAVELPDRGPGDGAVDGTAGGHVAEDGRARVTLARVGGAGTWWAGAKDAPVAHLRRHVEQVATARVRHQLEAREQRDRRRVAVGLRRAPARHHAHGFVGQDEAGRRQTRRSQRHHRALRYRTRQVQQCDVEAVVDLER